MPYVPVPKDLTKVKTKLAFNLTKRQLICFSLAALVGLPVYFPYPRRYRQLGGSAVDDRAYEPFFFFAMYERDGQPAEKLLKNRLRYKLWPKKRPYRTENLYKSLRRSLNPRVHAFRVLQGPQERRRRSQADLQRTQ